MEKNIKLKTIDQKIIKFKEYFPNFLTSKNGNIYTKLKSIKNKYVYNKVSKCNLTKTNILDYLSTEIEFEKESCDILLLNHKGKLFYKTINNSKFIEIKRRYFTYTFQS